MSAGKTFDLRPRNCRMNLILETRRDEHIVGAADDQRWHTNIFDRLADIVGTERFALQIKSGAGLPQWVFRPAHPGLNERRGGKHRFTEQHKGIEAADEF